MNDDDQHFVGKIAQKAIIKKGDKVLICKGIGDSVWEFPGGRLHNGESPKEGLLRELQEELSLPLTFEGPLHVGRSLHTKTGVWRVLIVYICSVVGDAEPKVDPAEVEDYKWITHEELKSISLFDDCREAADVFLTR